jgi:hypothetical protein
LSQATWIKSKGVLKIFVQFRDVNYPGPNYKLTYYPEKDMLIGKYFQAFEGQTYEVSFEII